MSEKEILSYPRLIKAVNLGALTEVKKLIKEGVNVNVVDIYGNTPLLLAFVRGDIEIARVLLEAGANFNVANNNGGFPKRVAMWEMQSENKAKFLELLEKFKDTEFTEENQIQNKLSDEEILDKVNKYANDYQEGALIKACIEGEDVVVIKELLKRDDIKSNINMKMEDKYHSSALSIAINTRREDIAEELLMAGCDVYVKDVRGRTPLMLAVNAYLPGFIEKLLQNKKVQETINVQDDNKHTALIFACDYLDKGDFQIAKMLLEKGADPNIANCFNNTALILACDKRNIDIAKMLLEYGANIEVTNNFGSTPKSIVKGDEEFEKLLSDYEKSRGLEKKDDKENEMPNNKLANIEEEKVLGEDESIQKYKGDI